jgi:hypothetical protein
VTALSLLGTGAVTTLAFVLAYAAFAKIRAPVDDGTHPLAVMALPIAELAIAVVALSAPTRVGASLLAAAFAAFTVHHARSAEEGGCDCFGSESRSTTGAKTILTGISALSMAVAAVAAPPPLSARNPASALPTVLLAFLAAMLWRRAFGGVGLARSSTVLSERLVHASASFVERRVSRRTLLLRVALTGSAMAVAPLRYLLYPISALAAITPGDCSGGLCLDGYTVFCCEINNGKNSCPPGTFPGGWWMCTSYSGGGLCAPQGVRYYVDCNALPGSSWGCECAFGSCANRRQACNIFRYGQCNTNVPGVTAVVCRQIVCENPGSISGLNCGSSVAVDDSVCGQDVPCLDVPPAVELAGAGGV